MAKFYFLLDSLSVARAHLIKPQRDRNDISYQTSLLTEADMGQPRRSKTRVGKSCVEP